jgi:hypothetical protein
VERREDVDGNRRNWRENVGGNRRNWREDARLVANAGPWRFSSRLAASLGSLSTGFVLGAPDGKLGRAGRKTILETAVGGVFDVGVP